MNGSGPPGVRNRVDGSADSVKNNFLPQNADAYVRAFNGLNIFHEKDPHFH